MVTHNQGLMNLIGKLGLAVSFGDEEAICLAKKRDEEIESGEVRELSHTELMNRLRR